MKRKMSWRSLKFIPVGGGESQAITRKHESFMTLCEQFRYGPPFPDYTLHDTKGMFERYGPNNVDVSWSDFRQALIKHQMKSPPKKPSVFHGEWFPPDHTIKMRKRLLASVCREYISAQSLAEDLLEWIAKGNEDDAHEFISAIFARVEWVDPKGTKDAPVASPATGDIPLTK